jgi:RNA polymerase sigma factor (sigma-70 family)
MSQELSDILNVIRACIAGNAETRRRFQEEYGEDIYNIPVKIYGLPLEEAGDFYVYVFDKDRIFTRLKTFTGLNIQFRTFLSYYVLKSLFLEWLRTKEEVKTISLYTPVGDATDGEMTLEDILRDGRVVEAEEELARREGQKPKLWDSLDPEEQLGLKLLYLIECELGPEDVRLLASISGRSIIDTLALVAEVREQLKRKDEKAAQLREKLDTVWGWIVQRQKELQEIGGKILLMKEIANAASQQQLLSRREALERSLTKRYRQRERILQEIRSFKLTTPYKDIARLLNVTVGTVSSQISRLRERLMDRREKNRAPEEQSL